VSIVSHSMGGLVSRYLVEALLPDLQNGRIEPAATAGDSLTQTAKNEQGKPHDYTPSHVVASLVTLDTPHLGQICATGRRKVQSAKKSGKAPPQGRRLGGPPPGAPKPYRAGTRGFLGT